MANRRFDLVAQQHWAARIWFAVCSGCAEYVEELLVVTNQSLVDAIAVLPADARAHIDKIIAENEELRSFVKEKERLLRSMGELHAQCLELHDVEAELHNELARVYVSATQLSSSISRPEIISALQQIIANLIGSEEVAILSSEPEIAGGTKPQVLSQWGIESDWIEKREEDWALIEEVLRTGSSFYSSGDFDEGELSEGTNQTLNACFVLRAGEKLAGAVAIFKLLPQKHSLTKADQQLCEMIAMLGGQALYCSELHSRLNPEQE